MPDFFDPSPRDSKRRRVTRSASTRSTVSEKDNSSYSVIRTVADTVSGLPRRLFETKKPSKAHVEHEDSAYGSKEGSLIGSDTVEAEAEDPAIVEGEEDAEAKLGMTTAKLQEPVNPPICRKDSRHINNGYGKLSERSSQRQQNFYNTHAGGIETATTPSNGTAASASGKGQSNTKSKRSVNQVAARAKGAHDERSILRLKSPAAPRATEAEREIVVAELRSSGRERKRPRRFSADGVQAEKPKKSKLSEQTPNEQMPEKRKSGEQSGSSKKKKLAGILTPSKTKDKHPRKSVAFEGGELRSEKDLGFKDIIVSSNDKSKKRSKSGTDDLVVPEDVAHPDAPVFEMQSEPQTEDEDTSDLLIVAAPAFEPSVSIDVEGIANDDHPYLTSIKSAVLSRLAMRKRPSSVPSHLTSPYNTLHSLLESTVTAGESNSLLLLGARGAGKTFLIDTALADLSINHSEDFHIVCLNGFVQTDDRLALREIWRQLGREMDVSEEETNQVVESYADTMASLLGLLSHQESFDEDDTTEVNASQKITKSVIFVLDEFDLFTTHPRQTLLYNLFDIAQSKKAPIAVIGCSTRMDVVDCLEKRVKSRFSHRWAHVCQAKGLRNFEDALSDALLVDENVVGMKKDEISWRRRWNEHIKTTFLPSPQVQYLIQQTLYTTKSLPDLFAALYIPVATLDVTKTTVNVSPPSAPSLTALLPSLPHLHLALLTSATRLETIHSLPYMNFNITYSHYTDLLTKSKLQSSALGAAASGMRSWGREVALRSWEELVGWGLLVPVGGKDEGMGEDSRMYRVDIGIEEVSWAVKGIGGGVGEGLGRWCREV